MPSLPCHLLLWGPCDGENQPRAGAATPGFEASESQEHSTPLVIRCFSFSWVILGDKSFRKAGGLLASPTPCPCAGKRQSPVWDWSPSSSVHTSLRLLCAPCLWRGSGFTEMAFYGKKGGKHPPALTSPPETAKIVMGSGEYGALSPHLQEGCS